jgi:hypothetical protein
MRLLHPHSYFIALLFTFALTAPAAAATLTLAWDPPADDTVEGYVILYGTSSGVYTATLDVGDVTSAPVSGLADSTRYFFVVRAYDETGALSGHSNEVSGMTPTTSTPPPPPPPPPPPVVEPPIVLPTPGGATSDGLSGHIREGRYLDLAWVPAPGAPRGYRVEVGRAFGETGFSALTPDQSIVFDLTDMPAETYFVRVRAVYESAYGPRSDELVVAPNGPIPPAESVSSDATAGQCVAPPRAPRQFSASAKGSAVVLNWQRGAGDAPGGFVLQAGSAPGLQDVLVAQFEANAVGVHANAGSAAYALRLTATNSCGTSLWGSETMLYVGVQPLPGAPITLTQQVTGALVSLAWEAPSSGGPVTRYLIEAATPAGPFVYDTGVPVLAFSHANTPPGQYIVTVRAGNATGFGPASRPVTVVVP